MALLSIKESHYFSLVSWLRVSSGCAPLGRRISGMKLGFKTLNSFCINEAAISTLSVDT